MHLTKSEREVMDVFWTVGKPMSQLEMLNHTEEKSWKDRSVYILLNGLLSKGALKEDGFVRSGKTFARRFIPTLTYEEYCVSEIASFKRRPDPSALLSAFLRQSELTEQDLESLEQLIVQKRREQQSK